MKNEGDTRIHEANASIFTVTFLAHLDKHGYVFVFLFLASAQDNVFLKNKKQLESLPCEKNNKIHSNVSIAM